MGIGSSSKRRSEWPHRHHQHSPPPPPPPPLPSPPSQLLSSSPPSFSSSSSSDPPISTFPPPPPHPPPSGYAFASDAPHPLAAACFPHDQPAPYPPVMPFPTPPPHAYQYWPPHPTGSYNPAGVFLGRPNCPYYAPNHGGAWWPPHAPMPHPAPSSSSFTAAQLPSPPPYVDHRQAVTIKNNVNLHKDTIRLEQDAHNPGHYLVCFTFDSLVDGSITILYFAKEGKNCRFLPLYPEICTPVRVPFKKGIGQKFCQPSGSGIDLGLFELADLSKPSKEDVFPLIVYAEACPESSHISEGFSQPPPASCAQITQAVIEKKGHRQFQVKAIKQILWTGGERYELKEIFGLANPGKAQFGDADSGKDCVICMSEPKDTTVLPCRHMCMCSGCAKELRFQSSKCPICRQPVEELMEIKVKCRSPVVSW